MKLVPGLEWLQMALRVGAVSGIIGALAARKWQLAVFAVACGLAAFCIGVIW